MEWSDELFRIFGKRRDADEMSRGSMLECVHPDDRQAFREYAQGIAAGKPTQPLEHRLQLRDGSLTFLGTRMWMGYSIYHFPLLSWMLAFALLGVLAIGWFYLRRFGVLEKRAVTTVRDTAALGHEP